MAKPKKRTIPANQKKLKFHLDLSTLVKDNLVELSHVHGYFSEKMKIGPQSTTQDASLLEISMNERMNHINFVAKAPLRKRAIKYYAKKYITKMQLRDYMRVVASNKQGFEVQYYKVASDQ